MNNVAGMMMYVENNDLEGDVANDDGASATVGGPQGWQDPEGKGGDEVGQ